jgi:hypothetical protein
MTKNMKRVEKSSTRGEGSGYKRALSDLQTQLVKLQLTCRLSSDHRLLGDGHRRALL